MTTMNDDVSLNSTRVDISNVNPGERGTPDQITIRARLASSLQDVSLSQSVTVIVQLESGSIQKDYDGALLEARKRAALIFDALARNLQT